MVKIAEGEGAKTLKCVFPDGWLAIKYDESDWHTKQMKSQSKAMDILATDGGSHWWIEIKDCEGYESANRPRLSPSDPKEVEQVRQWIKKQQYGQQVKAVRKKPFVVDEIVEKFRHTLAALACAERKGGAELAQYQVVCSKKPLFVVLLLTWDNKDFGRLAIRMQDKLKNALSCYSVDAYVTNGAISIPGLEMTIERIKP